MMDDEADTVHAHTCPGCWTKWECANDCRRQYGPLPFYPPAACSECLENKRSEELKHELDRFAAFIEAIRDLLRWIDVANRLELASVVLRSNMVNVIAEYGCDVDCRWDHDTRILPGEGCDGGSALCESHAMQRVLDMHYEDEGKLQREGELILAKGATQ